MDGSCSQEYRVNAGVPQGSILDPSLFLVYINDFPDDAFSNIAIYANDTTLYAKCDQASDLWQQAGYWIKSELRDTVVWGRKWCVDFYAGKLNFFRLTGLTTLMLLKKMYRSILEEESSFKMLGHYL